MNDRRARVRRMTEKRAAAVRPELRVVVKYEHDPMVVDGLVDLLQEILERIRNDGSP